MTFVSRRGATCKSWTRARVAASFVAAGLVDEIWLLRGPDTVGVDGVALELADRTGRKNRCLDTVHKAALRAALGHGSRTFERALDFGCGGGRLLPLLYSVAREAYGIDRTPECLDLARQQQLLPDDHLVLWRDGPAPFPDGYFDLVLCVYVLLTTEALDALTPEIARVLAPNGTALVLEQTDNGRGLTLERYRQAFSRAGLTLRDMRAVRRSGGSRAMKLVMKPWAPAWLTRPAAALEIASLRSRAYDAGTPGYWDYIFVLERDPLGSSSRTTLAGTPATNA